MPTVRLALRDNGIPEDFLRVGLNACLEPLVTAHSARSPHCRRPPIKFSFNRPLARHTHPSERGAPFERYEICCNDRWDHDCALFVRMHDDWTGTDRCSTGFSRSTGRCGCHSTALPHCCYREAGSRGGGNPGNQRRVYLGCLELRHRVRWGMHVHLGKGAGRAALSSFLQSRR